MKLSSRIGIMVLKNVSLVLITINFIWRRLAMRCVVRVDFMNNACVKFIKIRCMKK